MKKLTNKTIPLYAFAEFGPRLLGVLLTAYLLEALLPAGLDVEREFWSITGYSLVSVAGFSIIFTILTFSFSIFELKISAFLNNFNAKHGRYRLLMSICMIPMIILYALIWLPPSRQEGSILNTVYILVFVSLYYVFSSLWSLSYFSTFVEIVDNERDRVKLSSIKSIYDTIGYSVAFALLPLFISLGINIQTIVLYSLPVSASMLIPLFLIRGDGAPPAPAEKEEKTSTLDYLKHTFKYKEFIHYIFVVGVMWFRLEMFLSAENGIASGVLKLNGWQTALMNTSVFAPVPIAVIIFNRIQKKRGIRPAFQLALISFATAMLFYTVTGFFFASHDWHIRVILIAIGGLFGSYSVAVFFATLYIIPTQIAANDMKITGKNSTPMFMTVQTIVRAFTGALSGVLIYTNLKEVSFRGDDTFGMSLIAPIVALTSVITLLLTFKMPRNYEK